MTLYLLDANVLIRAHADYYPIDRIPQFWTWLLDRAERGQIKMPIQIYEEVYRSEDSLGQWLNQPAVRAAVVLEGQTDAVVLRRVIAEGYAADLDDVEIVTLGRDPFLIAAAMLGPDRVVVTREVSRPKAQRANRKVPDVCKTFGITAITDFELWRVLSFSTR